VPSAEAANVLVDSTLRVEITDRFGTKRALACARANLCPLAAWSQYDLRTALLARAEDKAALEK
jgi:hypothetical protein